MASEEVIIGTIAGVAAGVVSAVIATKVALKVNELAQEEKLNDAEVEGYKRGWAEAGNNARYVRQRFNQLFGNEE